MFGEKLLQRKWEGIEGIRRQEILNFMGLAEDEKDMDNLSRVVEDFLADDRDPKHKTSLLRDCIRTCYLRRDVKYSTHCIFTIMNHQRISTF